MLGEFKEYRSRLGLIVLLLGVVGVLLSAVEADAQDKMSVKVQQEFRITLPENPSTGFKWEARFNGDFLVLQSRKYVSAGTGRMGGGGLAVFSFLPLKQGETSLVFRYKRPWENGATRERSIHLSITE
ncbi:MAG: protease inhibitor I42 family protein [Thermodesulfobacteriota bacterium]